MSNLKKVLFLSFLAMTVSLFARASSYYTLPPGDPRASAITRESYESHFSRLESLYADRLRKGLDLPALLTPTWESPHFGAYVLRKDTHYMITALGGLARNRALGSDVLAFVLCHEVGHLLGGAPYQELPSMDWRSSAEGVADWFAAAECAPRAIEGTRSLESSVAAELRAGAEARCAGDGSVRDARGRYGEGFELCVRVGVAAAEFFQLVNALNSRPEKAPSLARVDSSRVKETLASRYPSYQCRLDTVMEGLRRFMRAGAGEAVPVDARESWPACWFAR